MTDPTPSITAEKARSLIGPIKRPNSFPGAWWIGTDKAKALAEEHADIRKKHGERFKEIAAEFDLDPDNVWIFRGGRISAVEPADPDNVPNYLREHPHDNGYLPDRRRKRGKELSAAIDAQNENNVELQDHIGGLKGFIMRPGPGFTSVMKQFSLGALSGYYPFAVISENPDDNPYAKGLEVDPELWTRLPVSLFVQITEMEATDA